MNAHRILTSCIAILAFAVGGQSSAHASGDEREVGTWPSTGVLRLGPKAPLTAQRLEPLRRELYSRATMPERSPAENRLIEAVQAGNSADARAALDAGARPNFRDDSNSPVLLRAVQGGTREIVRALLDAGADPNLKARGLTPLATAVRSNRWDLVRMLIDAGADVNVKDDSGNPPLNIAASLGYARIASELAAAGGRLERFGKDGWPPLVMAVRNGHVDTAKLLLDRGADVNMQGRDSFSPLYWAIYKRNRPMAQLLVARGAEVGALSVESLD